MGRWGSDVVALACIAGGAVVGSGVTAALFARSAGGEAQRVEVVCANESPRVVVQLSSGMVATSTRTVHVRSHARCNEAIHIDVEGLGDQMEEARERMEEARLRIEEARGRMEEAHVRVEEVRQVRERARVHIEGVEAEIIEVDELRAEELRAALESLESVRMDEVRAQLDKLRAEAEKARGSGGND